MDAADFTTAILTGLVNDIFSPIVRKRAFRISEHDPVHKTYGGVRLGQSSTLNI